MTETLHNGTTGNDLLDASAHTTTVVLRGDSGQDTLIGGSGNDRFDGGAGADSMSGGAGNDSFFVSLGAGERNTVDGGTGRDEVVITLSTAQLDDAAVKAELGRLADFLLSADGATTGASFVSDTLGLDLSNVESVRLRVGAEMKTLDQVLSQIIGNGTAGDDLIDASGHTTTVVLRGADGDDSLIGGSGDDRFNGGAGADVAQGNGGDDTFFMGLGENRIVGQNDTIDGGAGNDDLIITVGGHQLTDTLKAELLRLNNFTILHGDDSSAHFVSDILHLDMSGVETARVRLDGLMTSLDAVAPRILNGSFEASPDLAGWHAQPKTDQTWDQYDYFVQLDQQGWGNLLGKVALLGFAGQSATPGNWVFTAKGPSMNSDAFSARAGEHISFDFHLGGTWRSGTLVADLLDAETGALVQHLYTDSVGQWQDSPNFHADTASIATTGSYKLAFAVDSSTYDGIVGAMISVDNVVIA